MAFHYKNLVFLLFFFFAAVSYGKSINVRVLLSTAHHAEQATWNFISEKGFFIQVVGKKTKKKSVFQKKVKIRIHKGMVFCNDKKLNGDITIKPLCGYADCNGIEYDGCFYIAAEKNSF